MGMETARPRFEGRNNHRIALARLEQSNLTRQLTADVLRKRALGEVEPEIKESQSMSLWKKAIAVPALGLSLISACADNTVDSTTTLPPTTIESTTTVPTTTLPETTTTTSTTIPETTTTTEPEYPFNLPTTIGLPTGEIIDFETNKVVPLGVFEILTLPLTISNERYNKTWEIQNAIITGRIARLYIKIEEDMFDKEKTRENIYMDIVFGKYTNGDPIIVPWKVGSLGSTAYLSEWFDYTEGRNKSYEVTYDELINGESDIAIAFRERVDRHAQIKFTIPLFGDMENNLLKDSPLPCPIDLSKQECDQSFQRYFYNSENNELLVSLLTRGDIKIDEALSEDEYIIGGTSINIYPTPTP